MIIYINRDKPARHQLSGAADEHFYKREAVTRFSFWLQAFLPALFS